MYVANFTNSRAVTTLGSAACLVGIVHSLTTTYLHVSAGLRSLNEVGPVEIATALALIFAVLPFFVITQTRAQSVQGGTAAAGAVTAVAGLSFLATSSFWVMFLAFEALLLSAIYILLLTSKSERARDAALEMLIWTLVGSAGLLTGYGLLGDVCRYSSLPSRWGLAPTLCFLLGFGVKIPLWPTTSWLLKAHVEASVEFSILLSGFIVKLGVVGLHRTLGMAAEPRAGLLAAGLAVIGLFDAASRLPAQRDLKRVVALTTVVEMNWAVLALGLGGAQQVAIAGYLCLAHCLTTATEFFLVEVLTKRFGTRDVAYLGGVALAAPQLWLFSVAALLVTIGFPGTSLFWAKYLFFMGLIPALPGLALALGVLFLVVLPVFFVRLWSLIWFGSRSSGGVVYDLTRREALLLGLSVGGSFVIGLCPGLIFWAFAPSGGIPILL
jgi:formate hydrogenlyase subunit 3/multisubunit Na+/H+ antiporter MnhD subunit